jgi:hypothetical protein
MSFRTLALYVLLTLQGLSGLASPLDTSSSDELVVTPGGPVPKSNVHAVPEGATVRHTGSEVHLIAVDGTIIHSATVSSKAPSMAKIVSTTKTTRTTTAAAPLSTGYVAYSYWKNNATSNIASFSTSYVVPAVPSKSDDGQILYLWNGLVPNSFDAVLQPVLQYGNTPAGGGNSWAVASWWLVGAEVYYTNPAQVKPGETVTGVMTYTGNNTSGEYGWEASFKGLANTALTISTTEVLDWAYEAMEIYQATGDSDLPPAGATTMQDIDIVTVDGQHPALNWTTSAVTTEGFKAAVISSSSTNGAVQLTYP